MKVDSPRHPRIFSLFLAKSKKSVKNRRSLGFAIDLGVQVPEYEVDRSWRPDDHYDGGYLFRDKLNLEITPNSDGKWVLRCGFDSKTPNRVSRKEVDRVELGEGFAYEIPINSNTTPGIKATLKIHCTPWNED